jgi:hypothetical protein
MQNKGLQTAIDLITDFLNEDIKSENPQFESKTSDDLMFYFNTYTNVDGALLEDSISTAVLLSKTSQSVDFVLGMVIKDYATRSFESDQSVVNDFKKVEHRFANHVVEKCSLNASDLQLYSTLSVILNNFSDDFQEPLHVQLLDEAKWICLSMMSNAIHNKQMKRIAELLES